MQTTSTKIEPEELEELNRRFETATPQELLSWALERFGERISLACSLGIEDMVLVDMLVKIRLKPRVFVLDTGRLHQETYDVLDEARMKYGIEFEVYFPQMEKVQELLRLKGANSFYQSVEDRKECCGVRKVEPLGRALAGLEAWTTGLRREQSVTRTELNKIEIDDAHNNIVKINPLADWSEEQVKEYVKANRVPVNVLHNKGFPSIGCAPCTRAIAPDEDVRAGRWWWENPDLKECGLHVK